MSSSGKALIVEDDAKVRTLLRNVLEDDGFAVLEAGNADDALGLIKSSNPDLVTLDIQLGADNGLDLLRDVRKLSSVPVIMVSGKDDVIDRIVGLEIGADDYITKPFHVREVIARIRAVMRRRHQEIIEVEKPDDDESDAFFFDGLTAVPDKMEIYGRDGQLCDLTSGDFALLKAFIERPKRTLSRDQLMDLVGGQSWSPLDRTIDNQVARLRKKIERDPSDPRIIKTVRGVGYTFTCDVVRRGAQETTPKSA